MRGQGCTYKAIDEAVGVHRRTIAHWARFAVHEGEKTAIIGRQRGARHGVYRSLRPCQEVLIRTLMTNKMPDQLKLGFALWVSGVVREVIYQHCDFLMPVRAIGECRRRLSYTLQRPLHRTYQQVPDVAIDVYVHGQVWCDFTYVEDLVHDIRLLIDTVPRHGAAVDGSSLPRVALWRVVNIGNSTKVWMVENFIGVIEAATGKAAIRNHMDVLQCGAPVSWVDVSLPYDLTRYASQIGLCNGVTRFVGWCYWEYHCG